MRVLVTGGTGVLGRATVSALLAAGVTVRVLTRGLPGPDHDGREWATADFLTGAGLAQALQGVDTVVHAAHDGRVPMRGDQQGLRQLLAAVDRAGCPHFVYVSIVGARAVPGLPYYAAKARAEELVLAGGRNASLFRATQFHGFLDSLLARLDWAPVAALPQGLRFQPVAVAEVGAALARHALAPRPVGEFAGPEVRDLADLLRVRDAARGVQRPLWLLPVPLPLTAAIAAGRLTSQSAERGRQTWEAWLAAREAVASALPPASRRFRKPSPPPRP